MSKWRRWKENVGRGGDGNGGVAVVEFVSGGDGGRGASVGGVESGGVEGMWGGEGRIGGGGSGGRSVPVVELKVEEVGKWKWR